MSQCPKYNGILHRDTVPVLRSPEFVELESAYGKLCTEFNKGIGFQSLRFLLIHSNICPDLLRY